MIIPHIGYFGEKIVVNQYKIDFGEAIFGKWLPPPTTTPLIKILNNKVCCMKCNLPIFSTSKITCYINNIYVLISLIIL